MVSLPVAVSARGSRSHARVSKLRYTLARPRAASVRPPQVAVGVNLISLPDIILVNICSYLGASGARHDTNIARARARGRAC